MATYTRQINTALRLIQQKGRAVNIARESYGTYDPATQQTTSSGTTNLSLYGVTLPATTNKIEQFEFTFSDRGSLVSKEIRYIICAAKDATFTPQEGDIITVDGDDFHILGMTRLSPNGEDIIYKMGIYR